MFDDTTVNGWAFHHRRPQFRLPPAPAPIDQRRRRRDIAIGVALVALAGLLLYDAYWLARVFG